MDGYDKYELEDIPSNKSTKKRTMNNTDLAKLIEVKITALDKTMDLKFKMIDHNLRKVLNKQDETNGRVTLLEAFAMTFKYKLIFAIAIAVILAVVVHHFGLLELLNIIK